MRGDQRREGAKNGWQSAFMSEGKHNRICKNCKERALCNDPLTKFAKARVNRWISALPQISFAFQRARAGAIRLSPIAETTRARETQICQCDAV